MHQSLPHIDFKIHMNYYAWTYPNKICFCFIFQSGGWLSAIEVHCLKLTCFCVRLLHYNYECSCNADWLFSIVKCNGVCSWWLLQLPHPTVCTCVSDGGWGGVYEIRKECLLGWGWASEVDRKCVRKGTGACVVQLCAFIFVDVVYNFSLAAWPAHCPLKTAICLIF